MLTENLKRWRAIYGNSVSQLNSNKKGWIKNPALFYLSFFGYYIFVKELNLSTKSGLHHAYCILGDTDDITKKLKNFFLKELNFPVTNNPDFWCGEFDVMDIKDSRTIKSLHNSKPVLVDKKIFLIKTNFITEKAQNAMLKLFEEPRGDTHFFLVMSSLSNIIPTFKSRFFIVDEIGKENSIIDPAAFCKMSIGNRLKEIKKITDALSEEEKSKILVVKFINSLQKELKNRFDFYKINKDELYIFEDIEKIRQYLNDQSPSIKMLLEYIAIILPVFKD